MLITNRNRILEDAMTSLHDKRFPGEDATYRTARNALLEAEFALEEQLRKVAEMRQAVPAGGAIRQDYVFDTIEDGAMRQVRLSELFSPGKETLFLYSYMYGPDAEAPCPACTSLVDGFAGIAPHILARIDLAVVAKSSIEKFAKIAAARGWSGIRLLSSAGNSYNADYFAETPEGSQIPAANIFVKRDGEIRHFYNAEQLYVDLPGRHPRHVDRIWPIWNILDLTPEGRDDWFPRLNYD
jgi:predicted dithiol-disulfide oxidoreductase (DUF899 family)